MNAVKSLLVIAILVSHGFLAAMDVIVVQEWLTSTNAKMAVVCGPSLLENSSVVKPTP
jgi:hypothetical protein